MSGHKMIKVKHISVGIIALLSAVALPAQADIRPVSEPAPKAAVMESVLTAQYYQQQRPQARSQTISYAQAKSIAQSRVPGQVVDISLNGQTYRVRIQTRNGRVVDVYVDATTGRVR